MKNTLILSKALIKNNYPVNKKTLAVAVLLLVCVGPALFQLYTLFESMIREGMLRQAISLSLLIICGLGSFTVLFSFPTVFYFAKDTKYLLPLPLKPGEIISAKLVMIYLSQMVLDVLFIIPLWVACFHSDLSVIGWILLVFESLTIVFIPLFIIGIVVLVGMRMMPFFHNRDRFNLIFSILSILLVVVVSFTAGFTSSSNAIAMIDPTRLQVPTGIFFQIPWAVNAIVDLGISDLLLGIGVTILLGVVFWFCASKLYFPVVVNINQSSAKVRSKIKTGSPAVSYLRVQAKLMIRSPSYLTNMLLGAFIVPIMLTGIIIYFFYFEEPEIAEIFISPFRNNLAFWLLIGMAFGLFTSGTSSIAATAISRMGSSLPFYKALPIRMSEQIRLQVMIGMIFGFIPCLSFMIVLILFKVSLLGDLLFILGLFVSALLYNLIGILIDCFHPKLIWDDETAAIKNNLNSIFSLFSCWLLLAIFVLILWTIGFENYQMGAWLVLAVLILLDVIGWIVVPKTGEGFLKNKN